MLELVGLGTDGEREDGAQWRTKKGGFRKRDREGHAQEERKESSDEEIRIIQWKGSDFGVLERSPENSTGGQDNHSQYTFVLYSLFISAERTHNALGSRPSMFCKRFFCVTQKQVFGYLVCHMSHPWLFPHAISSMSTYFSATQREHSVHHAYLPDHRVDKLRH